MYALEVFLFFSIFSSYLGASATDCPPGTSPLKLQIDSKHFILKDVLSWTVKDVFKNENTVVGRAFTSLENHSYCIDTNGCFELDMIGSAESSCQVFFDDSPIDKNIFPSGTTYLQFGYGCLTRNDLFLSIEDTLNEENTNLRPSNYLMSSLDMGNVRSKHKSISRHFRSMQKKQKKLSSSVKRNLSISTTCGHGMFPLHLQLTTDMYPEDTFWEVMNYPDRHVTHISKKYQYKAFTSYDEILCVDPDSCYKFAIYDSFGDGICCLNGNGEYKVFYDGNLIIEGGDYLYTESSNTFGKACMLNLASQGVASQSSTCHGGEANRAIDNNNNPNWSSGSITHTCGAEGDWWKLDLPGNSTVQKIIITNRLDCCSDRLSSSEIQLLDEDEAVISLRFIEDATNTETFTFEYAMVQATSVKIILLGSARPLSLAEVEIFGILDSDSNTAFPPITNKPTPSPSFSTRPTWSLSPTFFFAENDNLALKGISSQSSTCFDGLATRATDGNTDSNWSSLSITRTCNNDPKPWWMVDWGSNIITIQKVAIWNRLDYCSECLSNSQVQLVDRDGLIVATKDIGDAKDKRIFTFHFELVEASAVRIQLLRPNVLRLAEVQVFGRAETPFVDTSYPTMSPEIWTSTPMPSTTSTIKNMNNTYSESKLRMSYDSAVVKAADGRRYFPRSVAHSNTTQFLEESQSVGDNGAESKLKLPPIDWAGKIHFTPPKCVSSADDESVKCEIGLPMSQLFSPKQVQTAGTNLGLNDVHFDLGIEGAPSAMEIGDMDDDGILDIVFGFPGKQNLILMNKGFESFHDPVPFPGPVMETRAIAIGDMNGDSIIDLVIGNKNQPNQILYGKGDGTFTNMSEFSGVEDTSALAVGDINNDGLLDIVVGNSGQENKIYVNLGDLNFEERNLSDDKIQTRSITLGDMNNDGYLDVVLGSQGERIQIFTNTGDGNFNMRKLSSSGSLLSIADMDGDGQVDIVVGFDSDVMILHAKNDYEETFIRSEIPHTTALALGDLDGDGLVDIVAGKYYNRATSVFRNNGDETYTSYAIPGEASYSVAIAIADIDNDGFAEVVEGNTPEGVFPKSRIIRRNIGLGVFSDSMNLEIKGKTLYDINSDGFSDIIYYNPNIPIKVYLGKGDGTFADAYVLSDSSMQVLSIAMGDVDGDDKIDIAVGTSRSVNRILMNKGNRYEAFDLPGDSMLYSNQIMLADMDNDGLIDVVVSNYDQSKQVIFNKGNGIFELSIIKGRGMLTKAITLGDVNNDGFLDIGVANTNWGAGTYQPSQLLINQGEGIFEEIILPGGGWSDTEDIKFGDVDGDGLLDIIIAKFDGDSQVLINEGNGKTYNEVDVFTTKMPVRDLAVADVDGNGHLDIIVGNQGVGNIVLLNKGNVVFEEISFPEVDDTQAIQLGDVDGDGLLDLLALNNGKDEIRLSSPCPSGGARLHGGSLCFRCPDYMGRPKTELGRELSKCVECTPDHMQQQGTGEQCSSSPCQLSERKLGFDECVVCSDGTYYDNNLVRDVKNSSTFEAIRCVPCPMGQYSDGSFPAVGECTKCAPGSFQPDEGQTSCVSCPAGAFQSELGQSKCNECNKGGYCDVGESCNGGFTPCPQGTYNPLPGQSDQSACLECPVGTFGTKNGATRCERCPAGSFGDSLGSLRCENCPPGTFQNVSGRTSCLPCEAGTYTNKAGLVECLPCPFRTSSAKGSELCDFCGKDFYLMTQHPLKIGAVFEKPDEHCRWCPPNAFCPQNTTLETIAIGENFWRDSMKTERLYKCDHNACTGFNNTIAFDENMMLSVETGSYCQPGHTGPLCQVCIDQNQFYTDGICSDCPSVGRISINIGIILCCVAIVIVIGFLYRGASRLILKRLNSMSSNYSIQAKFKSIVSFYQVVSILNDVYGVALDSSLQPWFDFFDFVNLNMLKIIGIPDTCIGSMTFRLIIGSVFPYFIVLIAIIGVMIYARIYSKDKIDFKTTICTNSVYGVILIFYLVLPSCTTQIFDALRCRSYKTNDVDESSSSYLVADLSIRCNRESNEFSDLQKMFYFFFVIWPVLVPLGFFAILMSVSKSVREKKSTPMTDACRFLWRDYNEDMMFWDVLDVLRKIFFTGFIMFIDVESGSDRVLRLIIATVVSSMFLCTLALLRPYKRADDLYLAFIGNVLLTCFFALGIVIQLCTNDDGSLCEQTIGMSFNSYKATLVALFLTLGMVVITAFFVFLLIMSQMYEPTVRLVRTGYKPIVEIPFEFEQHAFISHVWSTAQDKTHAIVRKFKNHCPEIKIWLDVDDLNSIGELESAVSKSVVFILHYSTGYFASRNCRRELYEAVTKRKPVVVLFQGDPLEFAELESECREHCNDDGPGAENILSHILKDDPIFWLKENYFSLESVKLLSLHILKHLPYYQRNSTDLKKGLRVYGQLGFVTLPRKLEINVCCSPTASDYVEELLTDLTAENKDVGAQSKENVDDKVDDGFGQKILLVYLNKDIFLHPEGREVEQIKAAMREEATKIVLVHEQDGDRGYCEFARFFKQTPEELVRMGLYSDMAVPLYLRPEYRTISLRMILMIFGGRLVTSRETISTSIGKKIFFSSSKEDGRDLFKKRRINDRSLKLIVEKSNEVPEANI